eukprot:4378443-Amphidinium_carterae.1
MLAFLNWSRSKQPSRHTLETFFHNRILPKNLDKAVDEAKRLEVAKKAGFTFLTVTNRGATRINRVRLQKEFTDAAKRLDQLADDVVPADPFCDGGLLVLETGMRVRMTQNLDKDRGFVNGNIGTVENVLRKDVAVVRTAQNILILVHPVTMRGDMFLPLTYAYATTIRRAQGATLQMVGLLFDRPYPDRGYGYVGASRVRRREDVYLVNKVRRTDWLPVGADSRGEQQNMV